MGTILSIDALVGFNANPPPNDSSETVDNTVDWDTHINKIGTPLNNYAQANFSNVVTALTKLIGGSGVTTVATSYAVLTSDQGKLVNVNGGSGVTVTTPDATTVGAPFVFGIVNTSSNDITFDGSGSQTVNGSANLTISPGASALLCTDGSNWFTFAAPHDPNRSSVFLTAQAFEGSVADGNVVYWDNGNSEWAKAQAGVTSATATGIADVTNGYVYGPGLVELSFDQGALTGGADYYLSETAGELSTTVASGGMKIGRALSATKLWFIPQNPIAGTPVLIERQTASASSSLDFETGLGTFFDEYFFVIRDLVPSADGSDLQMRISTNGGVTYESGASAYRWYYWTRIDGGPTSTGVDNSADSIQISIDIGVGTDTGEQGYSGKVFFHTPNTAQELTFTWSGWHDATNGNLALVKGAGRETGSGGVDAVQFLYDSGGSETITSGTIELYGIAK